MSAQQKKTTPESAMNEVRLIGRISQRPEQRVLPSGDVLWTFRVVVPRPEGTGRTAVDALECAAWSSRARRSVASWQPDDLVEVSGAVRRRFFRTAAGAASRVEVEMSRGRLIRRAGTG
ncbi:single-stranded DNA-binding protein [Nocardioides sp. URHA0020]|uniref:single-stranded DNA-binding protein n=1 Tax=Nocardioides sp. URHA0020 TaxID=1380392 RepID=UPI00048FCE5D|nr:single-stranded DNA-binding protein [Nocardioides sp. URHA0020]